MPSRYSCLRLVLSSLVLAGALLASGTHPCWATEDSKIEQTPAVQSSDGPALELPAATLAAMRRIAQTYIAGPAGDNASIPLTNIQGEYSVAASGSQVVAGFNDFRGTTSPTGSISGVIRSADGGNTFVDGGQLPAAGGTSAVQGDPVLAVYNPPVGPPVFYYASIFRPATGFVSLCIHRSTDGGMTWQGPYEVTSATHSTAVDNLEDKEWMTVDPETGRLFISWSRFVVGGLFVHMSVTYSDDAATGLPPTWAPAQEVGLRPQDGQGSHIACDPNSNNVYMVWTSFFAANVRQIAFVRSLDNGLIWTPAVDLLPAFFNSYPAYGFDRYIGSSFPHMAVNPVDGGIELIYCASATGTDVGDLGDVVYRRSTDGGLTWSAPTNLNFPAGSDRPQIYATVNAASDGRIDAYWYDESIGGGVSDLADVFYTFSYDYAASWSSPIYVTPKPFHVELGNNFSAPHQGDYIDAASGSPTGYAAFAWFGDPAILNAFPDPMVTHNAAPTQVATMRIRPGTIVIADHGCGADDGMLVAGEWAELTIPLENFGRSGLANIQATLSALTPGISVQAGARLYGAIASLTSGVSSDVYRIGLDAAYPCGQDARFRLDISATGVTPTFVEFSLRTGVVISNVAFFTQNFDGVVAPALPAGWTTANTPAWTTSAVGPASPPNAAFVTDSPSTTLPRLFSPTAAVPGGLTYVEVKFDTRYGFEQLDSRIAFDGGSWESGINGAGSRFATADCIDFTPRYSHYIVRSSGGNNGDRSVWSGNSGGAYVPVSILMPAAGMTTLLGRWTVSTDGSVGDLGMYVDNVEYRGITMGCGNCDPTPVLAAAFVAKEDAEGVLLTWYSDSPNVRGWYIDRSDRPDVGFERLTPEAIAMGAGGMFRYRDAVQGTGTAYYRLSALMYSGGETVVEATSFTPSTHPVAFAFTLAGANPFAGKTELSYALPERAPVKIEVYSVTGQRVRTLVSGVQDAGRYNVSFGLRDGARALPPGMYLIRIDAAGYDKTLRVVATE